MPTACPSPERLLDLVDGRSSPAERRAVLDHLELCSVCTAAIAHTSASTRRIDAVLERADPVREVEHGGRVGRYVVLSPLGSGGFATVFKAYDPELDRRIALKLLSPTIASRYGQDLLVHEAHVLARLNHPNVVAVYDAGVQDGIVFIAMEFIAGRTLRTEMGQRSPWRRARDIIVAAARGLAAAHAAKLVHRDVKPENILVGNDGRVRLVDFGLAHDGLADKGLHAGTPAYMSPEQHLGEPATSRSDQFALCVCLFEMLHGERPFRGSDLETLREAVTSGRIAVVSRGDVPRWLDEVVRRGLSRRPEDRHASIDALLVALAGPRARGPVLLLTGTLGLAALVGAFVWPTATEHVDPLDDFTNQARAAAARFFFVYPPHDDPNYASAYRWILRLESSGRGAAALALAAALRAEFADTLCRLGDRYWERTGGRIFSVEYYAQALVFDPERLTPRERVSLTDAQLAELRRRAGEQDFTESELIAAELVAAYAEADVDARARRLQMLQPFVTALPTPLATMLGILEVGRDEDLAGTATPIPRAPARDAAAVSDVLPAVAAATPALGNPPQAGTGERESGREERSGPLKTESAASAETKVASAHATAVELQAAGAAFERGDFDAAAAGYRRALRLDRRASAAHAGLAQVFFEQGRFSDALAAALMAVELAPGRADYYLLLGDAQLKVFRYDDARMSYERAATHGAPEAASRLRLLDTQLAGRAKGG